MTRHVMVLAALAMLVTMVTADAQTSEARRFGESVRGRDLMKQEHTGEQFCWNAAYSMGRFLSSYRATGDTEWLDEGVKYYELLLSKMDTGPDGYKGWIGPFIYDGSVWCDVHVGDAILIGPMLSFAEVVLKDEALTRKYGDYARKYVEVAKKHLIEKWDSRGTWHEDGPYGAYTSWDTYCEPGDLKHWRKRDDIGKSRLSLPFNKQNDMAKVCMRIYRITGDDWYYDKAKKIFAFARSRMQYFDHHYVWNYWEPFGPWDVDLEAGRTVHWVQVHPSRNYQAGEVSDIVEAYHTGIVFSKEDIQRIINTNLKVMWNGDRENPQFVNSNATHRKRPEGQKGAGTLWTGLLDFDQTLRDLSMAGRRGRGGGFTSPPSFERKYAPRRVEVLDFPTSECRDLHMAAVMPSVIRKGQKSIVMSKAWMPGELTIDVYSADGKEKELQLYRGPTPGGGDGMEGFFIYEWDGTDPGGKRELRGDYRVRWTFRGGHREFPVTIAGE